MTFDTGPLDHGIIVAHRHGRITSHAARVKRLKGFAKHTETLEEMVVYRAQYLAAAKPKRIFFLSTHGEKSLCECSFSEGDALVFGNESSGRPEDSLSATKSRRNRRGE